MCLEHAVLIWTWFANSHTGPRQMNGRIRGRTDVSTQPTRNSFQTIFLAPVGASTDVANAGGRRTDPVDGLRSTISSCDLKEVCDERGLRLHVATADVVNLPLSDHRHCFVAGQRLLCTQSLERSRVEFRACFHDDGLGAPSGFCSEIGDLLPIAPCGRTSL
jgi:hypothetical protein